MKFIKFVLFYFCLVAIGLSETTKDFSKLSDATLILYKQSQTGSMDMACTSTLFNKIENNYQLLTAAHCVVEEDQEHKSFITKKPIFVTLDELNDKGFIRATIERVGKTQNGYDFAILSINTDRKLTVLELGDDKKEKDGAAVLNLAVPSGLGKVCFRGFIAKREIDRPLQDETEKINWMGMMLLAIPISGGSSGSAVYSVDQEKVVAVMVGTVSGHAIAAPISRLNNSDKENWFEIKK